MTSAADLIPSFALLSYGGLYLCSMMLLAAILERALFALFAARCVRTAAAARGLFEGFRWVAAVAPLFGILGTVAGIMVSFRGEGFEPDRLLRGIGLSLWTTGLGLLAAILALSMRSLFVGVTERAIDRVESVASRSTT
ncbi:MAG: MotA/TolQ/ExbB proton channel family protein [Planctomycetota bacterium]